MLFHRRHDYRVVVTLKPDVRQLAVSEIFGPTFQGEGVSLGTQAVFLRLGLCNLKCVWCDTKYTWDWTTHNKNEQITLLDIDDVDQQVFSHGRSLGLLVVTGGEPLLQQIALRRLRCVDLYDRVEIETNGTILPGPDLLARENVWWNVSPKLAHAGNPERRDLPSMQAFATHPRAYFKWVVETVDDLDEIDNYAHHYRLYDDSRMYIMPQGVYGEAIANRGKQLADAVIEHGWNMTTRLHVLLWGNERGK